MRVCNIVTLWGLARQTARQIEKVSVPNLQRLGACVEPTTVVARGTTLQFKPYAPRTPSTALKQSRALDSVKSKLELATAFGNTSSTTSLKAEDQAEAATPSITVSKMAWLRVDTAGVSVPSPCPPDIALNIDAFDVEPSSNPCDLNAASRPGQRLSACTAAHRAAAQAGATPFSGPKNFEKCLFTSSVSWIILHDRAAPLPTVFAEPGRRPGAAAPGFT